MIQEDFSELDIIHHVSHTILVHKRNINLLMNEVFDVLQRDMNLQRGALTLKRGQLSYYRSFNRIIC